MKRTTVEAGSALRFVLTVCLALGLWVSSSGAQSASGSGTITAEATIYEEAASTNGGGYSSVCVGNLSTNRTRRGYVRYTLPAIPSGSTITRVVLTFRQERVRFRGTGPKTATLQLRRVLSAWTEGTGVAAQAACGGGANVPGINWANAPSVSGLDSGAEALSTTNGTLATFDTDVGTDDDGLIVDVQSWVDGADIHGWRVVVAEENSSDNARLMTPGVLTVHWTPPVMAIQPASWSRIKSLFD